MGMAIDAGEGPKHEPNVVPMIDIMLVLLIIFMIVTPVITAGFQAQMPQGKNLSDRAEYLTKVYSTRATDKILYFKADQNLEFSKVEGAIQIARKSGVRVMAAITEEKRGQQRGLFGR